MDVVTLCTYIVSKVYDFPSTNDQRDKWNNNNDALGRLYSWDYETIDVRFIGPFDSKGW